LAKSRNNTCGLPGWSAAEKAYDRHRWLLRARYERPRRRTTD